MYRHFTCPGGNSPNLDSTIISRSLGAPFPSTNQREHGPLNVLLDLVGVPAPSIYASVASLTSCALICVNLN